MPNRRSYSIEQKLRYLQEFEEEKELNPKLSISNFTISRDIPGESTFRGWQKKKAELIALTKNPIVSSAQLRQKLLGGGRGRAFSSIEQRGKEWLEEQTRKGLNVQPKCIKAKALEIRDALIENEHDQRVLGNLREFVASTTWIHNFKKRINDEKGTGQKIDENILRGDPKICQKHFRDVDFTTVPDCDGNPFLKRNNLSIPSVFKPFKMRVNAETIKKCRICFFNEGTLDISTEYITKHLSIKDSIMKTFDFSFNLNADFPQSICSGCYKHLAIAHNLKNQILKTDSILMRMAEDLNEKELNLKEEPKEETVVEEENAIFFINEVLTETVKEEVSTDEYVIEEVMDVIDDTMEVEIKEEIVDEFDSNIHVKETFQSNICKKCLFTAKNATELADHLESSSKDCLTSYDNVIECLLCQKKFIDERRKNQHVANDHKISDIPECKYCNRNTFKDFDSYEKHMEYHLKPSNSICNICGAAFFANNRLRLHMKIHEKTFLTCDICGFQNKLKAAMREHIKRHANIKPFICDMCSHNFINHADMKRHYFSRHKFTEDGCYLCVKCDYCYISKMHFKTHISRCNGKLLKVYPQHAVRIRRVDLDPRCIIKPQPEFK